MTNDEMFAIRERAEAAFKQQYPGVHGVGIGFRTRGGQRTSEVVLSVVVQVKKPLDQLAPEDVIPSTFEGMSTDVQTFLYGHELPGTDCENHLQFDPLVGGATVSTMRTITRPDGSPGVETGTLGFFATVTGLTAPKNVVLVTNAHVVEGAGATVGTTVYQPAYSNRTGSWNVVGLGGETATGPQAASIGPIHAIVPRAPDGNGFYIDAASVQLNFCISSCCNSNCGLKFLPHAIRQLNVGGANDIVDIAPANSVNVGDTVYKVGSTTARTAGTVLHVMHLGHEAVTNVPWPKIIVVSAASMSDATNCGGNLRFADHGDSGSALIDAQGRLIGLVFAGNPPDGTGFACYIEPVLAALNATAITRTHSITGNPAAEGTALTTPAFIDGRPNMTPRLRARALASEAGRTLWAVGDRHRLEVQRLVNDNRRVAVAWHRHKGPQFLARVIANARDPERRLPADIDGVTRAALLQAMAKALTEHGSDALRADIERHGARAHALLDAGDDLHELVEHLDEHEPA